MKTHYASKRRRRTRRAIHYFGLAPIVEGKEMTFRLGDTAIFDKVGQKNLETLIPLFTDPAFQKDVKSFGAVFGLPHKGEPNRKQLEDDLSLVYDDQALASLNITRPSRKAAYQAVLSRLMQKWELPNRFEESVSIYIRYGGWPTTYGHVPRVSLTVRHEHAPYRFLLEVFGDTKEEDVRKAWPYIKRLKSGYRPGLATKTSRLLPTVQTKPGQLPRLFLTLFPDTTIQDVRTVWGRVRRLQRRLPGPFLFRYRDYYLHKMTAENREPELVHSDPDADRFYGDQNLWRWRHRKHQQKEGQTVSRIRK